MTRELSIWITVLRLLGIQVRWRSPGLGKSQSKPSQKERFERGRLAEEHAEELLRRRGFEILESQPSAWTTLQVGQETVQSAIRADFLVKRRRRKYIVEVKSGEKAPDPNCRATRRQLREYWNIFPYPVLLLDAESGSLEPIHFLDQENLLRNSGTRWSLFAFCLLLWLMLDCLLGLL